MLNAFKLALFLLSLLLFYGLCDCLDIDTALEQRQRFRIDTRVSRSPDLPKYDLKNTIWNRKFRKNPKKFYQVVDKTYDDKYGFNTKKNFTTFLLETFQSASVKDVVKNKDVRVKYRELLENVRTNCGLRGLFTMLKCLRADAEDCKLDCEPKLEKREFDPEFEEFYRNLYGYRNERGQKRRHSADDSEDEGVSPNKKSRLDDQNNDLESDAYSDDGAETDVELSEGSEEYETEDFDTDHMLSYFSSRGNSTDSQKGSKEREKPRRSSFSEEDDEDSYSEDYTSESDSGSDDEEEERPDERKTRSKGKQKESTKDTERKRRREGFNEEEDSEEEPEEDRFTDNRNRNRGDDRDERRRRDSDEDEDLSEDETEKDRFRDNRDRDRDERRKSDDSYLRRKEEDDGNELREVGGYGQNQPRNSFWGGILSFIGKLTMGIIIGLCIIIVMVGLGILFTLGAMLIVTIALIIHAAVRGRSKNEESVNAALTPNNLPPSANNPSLPNNAAPAPSTDLVEQKEEAPRRPW
jgi:hypothetical protein